MACHAPLKCWAACRVDFQTLSTATIISFFFFFLRPWGSVEQKLSEDKQSRGCCCCHGLAVNAPGLTAGARGKGTEENTETERSGQNMKQKIVNAVALLDRTGFFVPCANWDGVYLQIELRRWDRELWNDLSLLRSWRIWASTAAAQGSTKAPLWTPVCKRAHMESEQREPVLGQSLVVRLSSYVCQCVQC